MPQTFLQGARNLYKGMAWYEINDFNPYNYVDVTLRGEGS